MDQQGYCLHEAEIATVKQQVNTLEKSQARQEELTDRLFEKMDRLMLTIWGFLATVAAGVLVQVIRWALEHKVII